MAKVFGKPPYEWLRLPSTETFLQALEATGKSRRSEEGSVMVNATEMAKAFGKLPADFLKTQRAQDYINELSSMKKIILADLVKVVNGGNNNGTWLHEDVALEFARWLSPHSSLQCTTIFLKSMVRKSEFGRL